MWKQILYLSWLIAAGCSDIADREYPEPQPAPAATTDSQATVQTRNLLGNLRSIAENGGTLFGHQCSSLYGIGWSGDVDRSDVKSICGDYPAMMGWDLADFNNRTCCQQVRLLSYRNKRSDRHDLPLLFGENLFEEFGELFEQFLRSYIHDVFRASLPYELPY